MARTYTTNRELYFKAPGFTLRDTVSDRDFGFEELKGEKATVVMFICNHCPFVIHVREALVELANDYASKGVGFIAISSNDVENYPQDGPEQMKALALEQHFPFPYLYDPTQEVAKSYDAACTPDFSVFNADDLCVYRGELDPSRPGNGITPSGSSIRKVLDLLIDGKEVPKDGQVPSIGCNIKWKTNEV